MTPIGCSTLARSFDLVQFFARSTASTTPPSHPNLLMFQDFTIGEDEPKNAGISGILQRVLRGGGRERPLSRR